jgi:putative endonuclease
MKPAGEAQGRGQVWELRAARYLSEHGVRVIAQRYRCRLGEIDLIGDDGRDLVFVEVRARARGSRGSALESIGRTKQVRIIRATRYFLMHHPHAQSRTLRFDIVAFDSIDTADPKITWVRNAFEAF